MLTTRKARTARLPLVLANYRVARAARSNRGGHHDKYKLPHYMYHFVFMAHPADSLVMSPCNITARHSLALELHFICSRLLIVERDAFKSRGHHDKYKLPHYMYHFVFMAHPARFERAIPAFGGRCSIQLSHGCVCQWQLYS